MHNGNTRRRDRNKRNTLNYTDWKFPQINVRHQTTHSENSDNTKQDKCQKKKKTPTISQINLKKIKVLILL